MNDKELYYDQHIAPKLAEMAKECEARGMPFLALVEWEPGEGGRTCTMPPGASFGIRMAETAARARGNVDSLILALMRYAAQHGHGSVCLSRLGVPHAPHVAKESNADFTGPTTGPAPEAGESVPARGADGLGPSDFVGQTEPRETKP